MIYNQFYKRIRLFRSDNAKEYFCGEVNKYKEQNGIIHLSSCANTPQQNSVAKRKIGHIMSSARALLFQGNCPKIYWSEAMATATHLVRIMMFAKKDLEDRERERLKIGRKNTIDR